jgi:hypothetical protein
MPRIIVILITVTCDPRYRKPGGLPAILIPARCLMAKDDRDLLDLLKFELKFLEDGGYGRSPHTPWRRPLVFEDSITCPNFGDPAHTQPCSECLLIDFVPAELRDQVSPCRLNSSDFEG